MGDSSVLDGGVSQVVRACGGAAVQGTTTATGGAGPPRREPVAASIYRILLRFQLVTGKPWRRRREDYKRWQRDKPMELWQMDLVGSCFLTDGRELKIVTGIDDHSRYWVIAAVVPRGTGARFALRSSAPCGRSGVRRRC